MRLNSISIQNYRVIKSAIIDFPDAVIGIIGQNGAGKSSIIEAITWALYGNQAARSSKDEIKSTLAHPDENCEVKLCFEASGEHYTIIRRLIGKSARPEVELYRGASSESIGSMETTKYVQKILGLDYRGFFSSFLARQQELNALSDLAPQKRREHLAGMLGIEKLDRAIDVAKGDAREAKARTETLENLLAEKPGLEDELVRLGEHVTTLKLSTLEAMGARDRAKLKLEAITKEYREHEALSAICSRLKGEISTLAASKDELGGRLKLRSDEIKKLELTAVEVKELGLKLEKLTPSPGRLDELRDLKAKDSNRLDLVEQAKGFNQEQKNNSQNLEKVELGLKELAASMQSIPESIDSDLKRANSDLESTRENYVAIRSKIEAGKIEIGKVGSQLESIDQIGTEAVCDRCHRPFGNDIPKIKMHLESELQNLTKSENGLKADLDELKKSGEKAKQIVDQLQVSIKKRFEFETLRNGSEQRKQDLTNHSDKISEKIISIDLKLKEIGDIKFDPEEFKRLQNEVETAKSVKERFDQLSGNLQRLDPARAELSKTEKQMAQVTATLSKNESELTELKFDDLKFSQLAQSLDLAGKEFDSKRDEASQQSNKLELVGKEIELKAERLVKLDEEAKHLDDLRQKRFHTEKLITLFGEYRKHVIASIRPRLSELASELISEMTGGRYSMVELDADYNMSIFDSSGFFKVDRFSGGEKDLANLCLRLAISLALSESAGLTRTFIILDEVFGSQDTDRRDLIFNGLVNLSKRFPQILLISHVDDIKDKVEMLIEVERNNGGWSEVKVSGLQTTQN